MKKFTVTVRVFRKHNLSSIVKRYQSNSDNMDYWIAKFSRFIKHPGEFVEVVIHKNTEEELKNGE